MVEVFKTNIQNPYLARLILTTIKSTFGCHQANFDLQDCDNILRVECSAEQVKPLVKLVTALGFYIEALPDDINAPQNVGEFKC